MAMAILLPWGQIYNGLKSLFNVQNYQKAKWILEGLGLSHEYAVMELTLKLKESSAPVNHKKPTCEHWVI